ncbi:hypothetical protein [Gilvibacter sediminis]|uniref:hypothetical protein n=1 Tax=Gilvibacter sediminis TaxID=379071 RepID=UPI002350647E|nr:hypothetical protein [Gilvibacter sediminis]MDC7996900.1 hypothetical protein [Gilvibacter sediminis]
MKHSLLPLWLCLFLSLSAFGQEFKTITGQLVDETGQPLPTVNIIEKFADGSLLTVSPVGTQTDFDGFFEITIHLDSTLEISFSGFSNEIFNPGRTEYHTLVLSPDGITSRYWCCTSHTEPKHCDKKKSKLQEQEVHDEDEKYRLSNG